MLKVCWMAPPATRKGHVIDGHVGAAGNSWPVELQAKFD
jgi:hypothetical protein